MPSLGKKYYSWIFAALIFRSHTLRYCDKIIPPFVPDRLSHNPQRFLTITNRLNPQEKTGVARAVGILGEEIEKRQGYRYAARASFY